ncbi:uncharacterized protein BDV14DRAFT_189969 [Aspergillus stella-maris]|uniref:uncharacterized protein n=1 Tax=Aspergillus stella-maris TaxID=1810926 RepID=UPI003CCCF43E
MKSATATKIPNGHGSLYKEVRFSPTNTPIKRAHSVANEHPTLHSDHLRSLEMAKQTLPGLALGYLEQSRSVLDRQRQNFDRERNLFAEERQLWDKERELLRLRISELESLLKSRGLPTTTTSATGALPHHGPSAISPSQVWEGSSPMSRPTRVFPDEERAEELQEGANSHSHSTLPAPSLDAALSPKSHPVESSGSISVPIEKLDSTLDGITLKSSALHPDVVARVMTPPSPLSREHSPECSSSDKPNMDRRNSVKLKLSDLGPPERNLLRDAGHTPMVVIDRDVDTAQGSPGESAPEDQKQDQDQEGALTPPVTRVRQPTERSDSYFSGVTDLPDDPALKGPLSLLNEKGHDEDFLSEVDMKLLGQARQILGPPKGVKDDDEEDGEEAETENAPKQGEELTEIKFRNTTNFGTAFGQSI